MTATFPEVFVLSIIAAALFWVLAAAVRWLLPLILIATWLAPVAGVTWFLWQLDDVLGGADHPGVALLLHVVSSIGMGSVMLFGAAAISTARSSGHGRGYGTAWWYMAHHHGHHRW